MGLAAVYAWSTPGVKKHGMYYRANLLTEEPDRYFVLEDPDPYLLEALENPGQWIYVENQTEATFFSQSAKHGYIYTIKYKENFYAIDEMGLDPTPFWNPDSLRSTTRLLAPFSFTVLAICWTVLVLKNTKIP